MSTVAYTDASQSQWAVFLDAGRSARFRDFALGGSSAWTWRIKYKSESGAIAVLFIDGGQVGQVALSASASYIHASVSALNIPEGRHEIRLAIQTGEAWIDSWTLDALGIVPTQPGQVNASFKAAAGSYVTAEGDGGGAVNANRPDANAWEMFLVFDTNGGALQDGDEITIGTGTGWYLHAVNGGGSTLDATATTVGTAELFRIHKRSAGDSTIRSGDSVAISASSGHYLSAENGNGIVNANRTAVGPWETFQFVVH